jgi:hypothetical protein
MLVYRLPISDMLLRAAAACCECEQNGASSDVFQICHLVTTEHVPSGCFYVLPFTSERLRIAHSQRAILRVTAVAVVVIDISSQS